CGSSHARVGHRQGLYPKSPSQKDGDFLLREKKAIARKKLRFMRLLRQSRERRRVGRKPQHQRRPHALCCDPDPAPIMQLASLAATA
ncbi:hypothetical protein, partial [Xanthomonas sp. F4]